MRSPFPLDEVKRVCCAVRVGGATGRRAVIGRRPRRFPQNRPPGRSRLLFVRLRRGLRRPLLRRRASSLSRPSDFASWSWESRRSARFVGAAVIVGVAAPCPVLGSPCPALPGRRSGSRGAAKQASRKQTRVAALSGEDSRALPSSSCVEGCVNTLSPLASCRKSACV